ncbi:MAG: undecaprenyl-diphosphatase UppP [Bacilli bacterium]|nr:undecaprenyl-diphosphatase UppP [Bacilli bacterium]
MDIGVIILAIIQGIAEFLPISSSAHLIIFRDLFGVGANVITKDFALVFDIALHLGTLLAIVIYFFKDFWTMFTKGITKGIKDKEGKIFYYLVIATIPAAIVGVLFEDMIDELVRGNYIVIASALILMGIIIYLADTTSKEVKSTEEMTLKDAIIIGISQAFALMPGLSRSGTTIATARLLKIDRTSAAKFSFYLSAPIVVGAVLIHLLDKTTIALITANLSIFIAGILTAFIVGLLCISFLLKYLKKNDFKIFMWYRILFGIAIIIYTLIK